MQTTSLDETLNRLSHRNNILGPHSKRRRLPEQITSQIRDQDSGADAEHHLERVETQSTKAKQKHGLCALHLAPSVNRMVGGGDRIRSNRCLGRAHTGRDVGEGPHMDRGVGCVEPVLAYARVMALLAELGEILGAFVAVWFAASWHGKQGHCIALGNGT